MLKEMMFKYSVLAFAIAFMLVLMEEHSLGLGVFFGTIPSLALSMYLEFIQYED